MVWCSLADNGFPPPLWGELTLTAVYLCNRIPHSAIQMETPHEVLYGRDANLPHLKCFGARAFVHIKDPVSLGTLPGKEWNAVSANKIEKSYRLGNTKTRDVVEARNVAFIETPLHLIQQPRRIFPLAGA